VFKSCPRFGFILLILKFGSLACCTTKFCFIWINPRVLSLSWSSLRPTVFSFPYYDPKSHWFKRIWSRFFLLEKKVLRYILGISEIPCLLGSGAHWHHPPCSLWVTWFPSPATGILGKTIALERHQSCLGMLVLILDCGDPDSRPQGPWFFPRLWENVVEINSSYNFFR
jgi:hypothetical protein